MQAYVRSLVDPFDTTIVQPKLLDGKGNRTAGLRFRVTGDITCDPAAPTYIALFPAMGNSFAYKSASEVTTVPVAYINHVETATAQAAVSQLRIVNAGIKLSLMNSSHENEGYWEAARFPISQISFAAPNDAQAGGTGTATTTAVFKNRIMVLETMLTTLGSNLSQNATFQTGKLRDLHRYLFKLNSNDDDHEFRAAPLSPSTLGATATIVEACLDRAYDVVIIKVHGRVDATSPSVLHYDVVSGQEVIYGETTVANRIMGVNTRIPNIETIIQKTNYKLPAIRIV